LSCRFDSSLFCLFGFILALACLKEPTVASEPEPEPSPIALGDVAPHPLIFRNVSYRIPTGTIIGEVRIGSRVVDEMRWSVARTRALDFNVSVTDGLRDLGYNMRDSADALFDPAADVKTRYVMAAILRSVALDFEYKRSRLRRQPEGIGIADVEVEVQLYDAVANKTVYKRVFAGHGEDEGMKPNPIIGAVVDAILKSTTDSDFVSLISRSPGTPLPPKTTVELIEFVACPIDESLSLPHDLEKSLEAVLEVQVGSVVGAGVIISPDGWILTAAHVVDGASEVWVRFANGAQLPATIQQSDSEFDVALLHIPGREYPCSRLRTHSKDLELGKDVFAINIALGQDRAPTVTRGVVSGYPEEKRKRYIQTDASVNPGSSGGPLLASDGTIAGITVAKVMGVGYEGLGFAVPINDVVRHLGVRLNDN
jgi:serine protease Do